MSIEAVQKYIKEQAEESRKEDSRSTHWYFGAKDNAWNLYKKQKMNIIIDKSPKTSYYNKVLKHIC